MDKAIIPASCPSVAGTVSPSYLLFFGCGIDLEKLQPRQVRDQLTWYRLARIIWN
jgi:hypothetical protein